MKNLVSHSLLRWKMIILTNSHYLTYAFLFESLGECTFWTWEWKGLSRVCTNGNVCVLLSPESSHCSCETTGHQRKNNRQSDFVSVWAEQKCLSTSVARIRSKWGKVKASANPLMTNPAPDSLQRNLIMVFERLGCEDCLSAPAERFARAILTGWI